MKKSLQTIVAALAITAAAGALAQVSAEDAIKFRQSGYTFISWNMGIIRAALESPEYNQDQVARAADTIAAIANSGLGSLYLPGTDQGTGWKPTRLESKFFDELDKAGPIGANFVEQANKLQEVASTGDKQAVAAQFAQLGDACRSCHQNYRKPE